MYQNIITKVTEIKEATLVDDIHPFYVFLFSKEGESNTAIVNGLPSYQKEMTDLPLTSMMWNPIALIKINVTSELLTDYRIFIGYIE